MCTMPYLHDVLCTQYSMCTMLYVHGAVCTRCCIAQCSACTYLIILVTQSFSFGSPRRSYVVKQRHGHSMLPKAWKHRFSSHPDPRILWTFSQPPGLSHLFMAARTSPSEQGSRYYIQWHKPSPCPMGESQASASLVLPSPWLPGASLAGTGALQEVACVAFCLWYVVVQVNS